MQIIESFICGKENDPNTCEDGIVMGENFAAVIDGVTAKGKRLWNGKKSGYYAKECLIDALKNGVKEQNAEALFCRLDTVLKECAAVCEEELQIEEYPRASIILYQDDKKEIWSYGDCQCSINGICYTHTKKIDELNADLRAYYLEEFLLKGGTLEEVRENDLGRAAIRKNLMMQFAFENQKVPFGYPVLNGMGIEPSMIKVYSLQAGDEVILASDGYPELGRSLVESEGMLKNLLKKDPMCFREYSSTKGVKAGNQSFDDRAFCKIIV